MTRLRQDSMLRAPGMLQAFVGAAKWDLLDEM